METENNRNDRRRRRTKKSADKPRQEIEYTQPKPFFRKRLTMQLLTIAAVALAVALGVSIFFQVDTVEVTGAQKYSALSVAEASRIREGDSLLFFGRGQAARRIKDQLPYVGTVRFEIRLPGTVNIVIEEKTVAYALQATDGSWWKMTADGVIVEKVEDEDHIGATVTGVILKDPAVGQKAVADESAQDNVTTTEANRLQAAVDILEQLEAWELFSDVTGVDVGDLFALRLYCGSDYRVELGNGQELEEKISVVKSILVDPSAPESGVLKLFYEDGNWQAQYNPWA